MRKKKHGGEGSHYRTFTRSLSFSSFSRRGDLTEIKLFVTTAKLHFLITAVRPVENEILLISANRSTNQWSKAQAD